MKIGVITWFNYENYGTVLQALALQTYLKNNGYNAELINFELDDSLNLNKVKKPITFNRIYHKIGTFIYKFQIKKYNELISKKSRDFKNIIFDNCTVTKKIESERDYINICNSYDVLIFGSDQIWNPNWYHSFYYANFKDINTKLIAYAPSFGVSNIPEDKVHDIKNALKRFSHIALRETLNSEILENITDKKIDVVVDPTFLLTANEWEKYEESVDLNVKDYILCYFLTDNPKHWYAAKKFAKKHNKKLVIIPHDGYSYIKSKYVIKDCNVGNFLNLIRNAEYVITDSFHATVFSIINQKKFYVFERHNPKSNDSQNIRIYNLLNSLKAESCLIKYNIKKINKEFSLNYESLFKILNSKISESKKYLEKSLNEE